MDEENTVMGAIVVFAPVGEKVQFLPNEHLHTLAL